MSRASCLTCRMISVEDSAVLKPERVGRTNKDCLEKQFPRSSLDGCPYKEGLGFGVSCLFESTCIRSKVI